jgi:hypothetical protein
MSQDIKQTLLSELEQDRCLLDQEAQLLNLIEDYSKRLNEFNQNRAKILRRLNYLRLELERVRLSKSVGHSHLDAQ